MKVCVEEDVFGFDLAAALAEVTPERREKALRFRFERDRRLSVAVYRLLRKALREVYGIDELPRLAVMPGGKPFLPDHPGIHFNFSHCREAAACVVADVPVGIDVESVAPVDPAVAGRVLSTAERERLAAADDPATEFAVLWTRKEALVKLRGEGLDDRLLPGLLDSGVDVRLETEVRSGYVLSTALARVPDDGSRRRYGTIPPVVESVRGA